MSHEPAVDARSLAERVLVFAPIGRDAELTERLLAHAAVPSLVCRSVGVLTETFERESAGTMLLTEEVLDDPACNDLRDALDRQAPWSDVPILMLAGADGIVSRRAVDAIDLFRNITLLERPIRLATVVSMVRAALRSRTRQYETRDLLVALHRARREAESANRLKDEFLATLSHELRTPLNAIVGWTSMLSRGQIEPARLPRVFDALERNAQVQAQLIADVLDVSRIITGKLQLHLSTVDIGDPIARAVDAVRPAANAKGVTLSIEEAPDCIVRGDDGRLQQVFWNLLSNAVKFTPSGGSVRVAVTREAGGISVCVTDTGAGISSDFLPFVFDRFRQADQTSTRTHGGLGLGLSIVKHLTELHGGTVNAFSAGPGRGARFHVALPAAPRESSAAVAETASSAHDISLAGHSIVGLDDDESSREVVAAALEHAGAAVRLAASTTDARRLLDDQTPSLLIADLGMPGEDGFSFIARVRRSSAAHLLPAIAFSAYADPQSQAKALAAGFDAFLAKPARTASLLELVSTVLRKASDD